MKGETSTIVVAFGISHYESHRVQTVQHVFMWQYATCGESVLVDLLDRAVYGEILENPSIKFRVWSSVTSSRVASDPV